MTLEMLREFFGWGTLINYGILLFWFIFFVFGNNLVMKLHGRWFKLSEEDFHRIHYQSMAVYKMMIFIFFLVPWIVLLIF